MSLHNDPYAAALSDGDARHAGASNWFIFVYWFAQFGNWMGLLTPVVVTIALKVSTMSTGQQKAEQLGLVLAVGAFASAVAAPIWGAISDRTRWRWGRRKPWMVIGVVGGGIGLLTMALAPNMLVIGVGWFLCQVAFNCNQAALYAVLPDQIPERQRGKVSGLIGLSSTVAVLGGSFLTQYTSGNDLMMFLAPYAVTVVALVLILVVLPDRPADPERLPPFSAVEFARSFWISPRRHPDFGWAFLSRFLLLMGTAYLQTYQVYFLTDHLEVTSSEVTRFVFLSTLITAAITVLVSIGGGYLSDRLRRRKIFVLGAALVAGAGLLVIGTSVSLPQFFAGVLITSFGQGLYSAVDLALVTDVLPNPDEAAKDMGIFMISNTLPQSLAPVIAPVFLAIGAAGVANYPSVFVAATLFAVVGALAVMPIRGTR